jgi:hypothetical protein
MTTLAYERATIAGDAGERAPTPSAVVSRPFHCGTVNAEGVLPRG